MMSGAHLQRARARAREGEKRRARAGARAGARAPIFSTSESAGATNFPERTNALDI